MGKRYERRRRRVSKENEISAVYYFASFFWILWNVLLICFCCFFGLVENYHMFSSSSLHCILLGNFAIDQQTKTKWNRYAIDIHWLECRCRFSLLFLWNVTIYLCLCRSDNRHFDKKCRNTVKSSKSL